MLMMNTADRLRAEGFAEGYSEVRTAGCSEEYSEGYTEGFARTYVDTFEKWHQDGCAVYILDQLRHQFGDLSDEIVERVRAGDKRAWRRAVRQIIGARSLEEVFQVNDDEEEDDHWDEEVDEWAFLLPSCDRRDVGT